MCNQLRTQVLKCYKSLIKTRSQVFAGDDTALSVVLNQIRHEFRKNKNETNVQNIRDQLQVGMDAEIILRKTVIQAKRVDNGNYEIQIREDLFDSADHSKQKK